MDFDERRELFNVLRHQLSAILRRRISYVADKTQREALEAQLEEVRELFLVPANIKESTFKAKWTPKYTDDVFAKYGALLQAVGEHGTVLRRVGDDLASALPPDSAGDVRFMCAPRSSAPSQRERSVG